MFSVGIVARSELIILNEQIHDIKNSFNLLSNQRCLQAKLSLS